MSTELVMPSSHLILCCPLFLLPPIPPSTRVFSNESILHMRWPKYWSFSFSIIPSKEHPGLICFKMAHVKKVLNTKTETKKTNRPSDVAYRSTWGIRQVSVRRIDAFELWCWRRLLRVPWTARRSNQSILKQISPGCSLEGLMPKLKLQYFGHLV